jgi:hypothetical protein
MLAAQKAATCARIPPNRIAGLPFVQYNGALLRGAARATEQESPAHQTPDVARAFVQKLVRSGA